MPHIVQFTVAMFLIPCFMGLSYEVVERYTISEILAVTSYSFLIVSMTQHDIVKLRLFGACAGICFVIQFALSDLPFINVLGQGALVIYGIYQAIQEIKAKKSLAITSKTG